MYTDIQWVLNTPSLMRLPEHIVEFSELLASRFTQADTPTIAYENAPRKLGIYYEELINQILISHDYIIDFKRNVKVMADKITQGEYDFIGRSLAGDFHLEVTVKFYLRVGKGDQLSDYIGPGKRDRLDKKWQRLINHQIQLSQTAIGKRTCESYGWLPSIHSILMQGYLFHPFDEGLPDTLAPEINPKHLTGWWLRQHEISKLNCEDQFLVLKKPFWLIPDSRLAADKSVTNHSAEVMDYSTFKALIENMNHSDSQPLLISRGALISDRHLNDKGMNIKSDDEPMWTWVEKDRGFVVPDNW